MTKHALRLATVVVVAAVTNAVAFYVLLGNMRSGVYRDDADSISIPIMSNALASLFVIALMAGCVLTIRRNRFASSLGILFGVLAVAISVSCALYWLTPHHYLIALSFGFLVAVCAHIVYSAGRLWWQSSYTR